jgi:MoxR-like ATPase
MITTIEPKVAFSETEEAAINKIKLQKQALTTYFKERSEIIDTMFLCLLIRRHQLQIGPQGSAKSYLIESFCSGFEHFSMFAYQLNKFVTPDELFGMYDISKLKEGHLCRLGKGKMQNAKIAYIDEVFNGSPAILNKCNEIMNERRLEGEPAEVEIVIGATNMISDEPEVAAYFDRFLFRHTVKYIQNERAFEEMLLSPPFFHRSEDVVAFEEIEALRNRVTQISITGVMPYITRLRAELIKNGIQPSDRRFKWSIAALQAQALMNNRNEVFEKDLHILQHILWIDPKDQILIEQILLKLLATAEVDDFMHGIIQLKQETEKLQPDREKELSLIFGNLQKIKNFVNQIQQIYQDHLKKHEDDEEDPQITKDLQSKLKTAEEILTTLNNEKLSVLKSSF